MEKEVEAQVLVQLSRMCDEHNFLAFLIDIDHPKSLVDCDNDYKMEGNTHLCPLLDMRCFYSSRWIQTLCIG